LLEELNFDHQGLIPAIIVDLTSGKVLTLCYMNKEALKKTLKTGKVYVFRRAQGRVMQKGEISGHTQSVKEIYIDCEGNSLLIKVEQKIAACHQGYFTCYFRKFNPSTKQLEIVGQKIFTPEQVYKK
jgi:phosphoribosyl-AMP cyclohydrolase